MLPDPEKAHQKHRAHRRLRLRLHLLCVGAAGLALFAFCVLHGINKTDSHYTLELVGACVIALLGGYSGVRAFKRARRWQRLVVLIAFALLGSSLVTTLFLSRSGDPSPSLPPANEPE